MDKTNFLKFARGRYSCRKLTGVPVAAEKLGRILEVVCIVPTAHNERPFRVFLLGSPEAMEKVCEITPCTFETDCFLMVAAVLNEAWVRKLDRTNFVTVDTNIIATHIMLAIEAERFGMTWVGYFDAPCAREFFPVMVLYELIVLFPIGEKTVEIHSAHLHEEREPIADLVERS